MRPPYPIRIWGEISASKDHGHRAGHDRRREQAGDRRGGQTGDHDYDHHPAGLEQGRCEQPNRERDDRERDGGA